MNRWGPVLWHRESRRHPTKSGDRTFHTVIFVNIHFPHISDFTLFYRGFAWWIPRNPFQVSCNVVVVRTWYLNQVCGLSSTGCPCRSGQRRASSVSFQGGRVLRLPRRRWTFRSPFVLTPLTSAICRDCCNGVCYTCLQENEGKPSTSPIFLHKVRIYWNSTIRQFDIYTFYECNCNSESFIYIYIIL